MTNKMTKINNAQKCLSSGEMCDAYRFFGSRTNGGFTSFLVWAPNAEEGFVKFSHKLVPMERNGDVWFAEVEGNISEYRYVFEKNGEFFEKNDPFAFSVSPNQWSEVCSIDKITNGRLGTNAGYMNIYELHVEAWTGGGSFSSIADELGRYVLDNGYNFVELMPINSHPCRASWGYQAAGYFAFQYGSPQEFAEFVKKMHRLGIGVIADWVPGHFACDSFGLSEFDGTPLFEGDDREVSQNRIWGTVNSDFSKPEVCSFFLSSACYLADVFGIDGIRVDAVSNMLVKGFEGYRTRFSEGTVKPYAIDFLKKFNSEMKKRGVLTIAEDTFGEISATGSAGLGFDRVWNMGWFHDILVFLSAPPGARCALEQYLLKPFEYMNSEKYILPVSHDENVHGKRSVFGKLPSDGGRSYRLLLALMTAFPGDKLLFSGTEYAAEEEWNGISPQKRSRLGNEIAEFSKMLNFLQRDEESLHGFSCEYDRLDNGVLSFIRKNESDEDDFLIFIFNFSDTGYDKYYIGIDRFTDYKEVFVTSEERECRVYSPEAYGINNKNFRTEVNLPPLCGLALKPVFGGKKY